MKFAILGSDADIVRLSSAACELGHSIAWIGDIRPQDAVAIWPIAADRTDRSAEWELLLGQGVVDAVLVGRGAAESDVRAEQLKRLVAEAIPVLVVQPIFESVLPYYEIDMTRRETGAIVQHFNPLPPREVLNQLAEWVRNGHPTIGPVHQVTCERHITVSTRAGVLGYLSRDAELIAAVAGDIRRVSAIGPATLDSTFASLQVQMTTTAASSVRWSVSSAASGTAAVQIALLGERGTVLLRGFTRSTTTPSWILETPADSANVGQVLNTADAAQAAIERLVEAIAQESPTARVAASTWGAATRDMELVDAVELSLQKGRTIEVFQQQLTEQLAFRGTMAALGCGLMLLAFFGVIGVALLGGAEGVLRQRIAPAWPLVLLAVLALFLLLQAVPLLAQKSRKSADANSAIEKDA